MEKDVREIFERIEKRLNDIEGLGKQLKNGIDQISTEIMEAEHASGEVAPFVWTECALL